MIGEIQIRQFLNPFSLPLTITWNRMTCSWLQYDFTTNTLSV